MMDGVNPDMIVGVNTEVHSSSYGALTRRQTADAARVSFLIRLSPVRNSSSQLVVSMPMSTTFARSSGPR